MGKATCGLTLYQAETAQTARHYGAMLEEVQERLSTGGELSRLEQRGVLHALQVLLENAIGKAKQIIKSSGEPVSVSAYDAFAALARLKVIAESDLPDWNASIGLRNRIVHEYRHGSCTRAGSIGPAQVRNRFVAVSHPDALRKVRIDQTF